MALEIRFLEFTISDDNGDLAATIRIAELDDGTLQFEVTSETADNVRALYFDFDDLSLLDGLTASTGFYSFDGDVANLGKGTNINGTIWNEHGGFDGGVAFGAASSDVQSTTFILDHSSEDLTLDMIEEQQFAIRTISSGGKYIGTSPTAPILEEEVGVEDQFVFSNEEGAGGSLATIAEIDVVEVGVEYTEEVPMDIEPTDPFDPQVQVENFSEEWMI